MALTDAKLAKIGTELESREMAKGLTPDADTANITAVILTDAGVDIEAVAKTIARGLVAKKKISLEETLFDENNQPCFDAHGKAVNVKHIFTVDNDEVQQKTAATVMALLTPKTTGPAVGTMNIIVPQVPAEMLQLRGDAAQKYYVDRTRALALGQQPPPIENYLSEKKEGLDGLEETVQPDSVVEG